MQKIKQDQQGIAHIVLILLVVVVLGAVGFAGYKVMKSKNNKTVTTPAQKAAESECKKFNDKDICKFISSWKINTKYRMVSTDASGNKSTFEIDGENTHIVTSGSLAFEIITIGKNTTYTKAGDVWYKQTTTPAEEQATTTATPKVDFKEPATTDATTTQSAPTYNKLGKEACGKFRCFKYQVVDPANPGEKSFIWFDDSQYQLRRTQIVTAEGTTDVTFEYDNVKVGVPSPVKDLAPGQFIMPGATEPTTIPTATDNTTVQ